MSWFFTNLINEFLLPPLNLLLVGLVGFFLINSRPRLGRILLVFSLALQWLCATPFIADGALHLLTARIKSVNPESQPADAILVLGAGTYFSPPEYGGLDTVSGLTLMRLRYAAQLQRETGKPIMVSGGKPRGSDTSEAQQMKSVLENEFNVPVQWIEDASNNTLEEAQYSYKILHNVDIKHIYLVSDFWHLPRAIMAFQCAGFDVTPAPLPYTSHKLGIYSFIPSAQGLGNARIFIHEITGLLYYRFRYYATNC